MLDRQGRHVLCARHGIVHEGAGEELACFIVDQLLAKGRPDPLGQTAVNLPLDDHGVDGAPAVMRRDILEELRRAGLDVHLQRDGMYAKGPGYRAGIVESAGIEAGASCIGQRAAPHRGLRHRGEWQALARHPRHHHAAVIQDDVFGRALEEAGRDHPRFLRGPGDSRSRHGGHAARDGA